jgi:hypothetical protein
MKTANTFPTSQPGLPAHALRPAKPTNSKGINVAFKHTSSASFQQDGPKVRSSAAYAQAALVKLRQAQRGTSITDAYVKKAAIYNGAELKPYQGRPGSLDFLAMPSLIGHKRIYRADQTTPEAQA